MMGLNGPHPQPYGLGRPDGTAAAQSCAPGSEAPIALVRGAQPWLVPGRVGQVVGQDAKGQPFAIAQTPLDAVRIRPTGGPARPLQLAAAGQIVFLDLMGDFCPVPQKWCGRLASTLIKFRRVLRLRSSGKFAKASNRERLASLLCRAACLLRFP